MSISKNHAAIEIISRAVEQLQVIGVQCLVSPLSLPQGASIALHLGETVEAVVAADVATTKGAELAHTRGTAGQFASDVASALTDATIQKASRNSGDA
jgi:hypothetical protein